MATQQEIEAQNPQKVKRGLGLMDSAMLIMGSMIGSGIFRVSAGIAADVKSPGMLLLNWVLAGAITIFGALSYGELAAAMPRAGGQYIYLREAYNKLIGFLYGWTLFAVIQTGTIAAVAVTFANFTSIFVPYFASDNYVIHTDSFHVSSQQLLAIAVIFLLSFSNFRSVKSGARLQNLLTVIKIGSLAFLIGLGLWYGLSGQGSPGNFTPFMPDHLETGFISIFLAAMVGSLFSADAWNNITFTAGEIHNPQRNLPRSLVLGTGTVILIYILVNVAYLYVLPISGIANAKDGLVATAMTQKILGDSGLFIMAAMVMVSTFGCLNGIILAGARVYYSMAVDGLFFRPAARLNKNSVPANSLLCQAIWASLLALSGRYNDLLDYVMFGVLLFYILTIGGIFILRVKRPDMERPYKAWGYPVIPAAYIILALSICITLLLNDKTSKNTWPGLYIILAGIPVYVIVEWFGRRNASKK